MQFYETQAGEFLKLKGYKLLDRNVRSRFGEIDIVAREGETISFIEVKKRSKVSLYSGREAVTRHKRDRIRKTALLLTSKAPDKAYRFDVIEIIEGRLWRQYELIRDAFNLDEEP